MSADETDLGATIRAWRDRLTPAEVELPVGRARVVRDDIGQLQVGARADLVWWSDDLRPQCIWLDGQQLPEARAATGPEAGAGTEK